MHRKLTSMETVSKWKFLPFFLFHKLLFKECRLRVTDSKVLKSLAATVQDLYAFPILSFVKELEQLITSKSTKKALFFNEVISYTDSAPISNISLLTGLKSCERKTVYTIQTVNLITRGVFTRRQRPPSPGQSKDFSIVQFPFRGLEDTSQFEPSKPVRRIEIVGWRRQVLVYNYLSSSARVNAHTQGYRVVC